jgi:hypothetical protein
MPPQQTNITSEAEGLPVELVSTWSMPGLLAQYWRALQDWRWRQGPHLALSRGGDVTDEPSEAEMRFASKQPSARLLVLRRALRAGSATIMPSSGPFLTAK